MHNPFQAACPRPIHVFTSFCYAGWHDPVKFVVSSDTLRQAMFMAGLPVIRSASVALCLVAMATALSTVVTAIVPEASDAARGRRHTRSEIVNGWSAAPGQYPFVAGVGWADPSGGFLWENQFCGGSLIAASSVLTAAHCVAGTSPEQLAVVVGRTFMSSSDGQVRHVSTIWIHPAYDPRQAVNDLAVLRLDSPIIDITPIDLVGAGDQSLDVAGTPLTVVGWGDRRPDPHPGKRAWWPDQLQLMQVSVVGDGACAKQWRRANYENASAWPTLICTNAGRFGSGDSGGPVFTVVNGAFVQVSVVSGGYAGEPKSYEKSKQTKKAKEERSLQKHVPDYGPQLSAPISADFIASVRA